jgi:hypothetical protein
VPHLLLALPLPPSVASAMAAAAAPFTAIASGPGVSPAGAVHETDAGWDLLEQTLQPWRDDLDRLAAARLDRHARQLVLGVIGRAAPPVR